MTRCWLLSIGLQRWLTSLHAPKPFPEGMVHLLLNNVVRLHGLPDYVISNRGPQFVSHFWQHLLQTLGISVNLSSAYQLQTDGQTESVNKILEQYLRCSVSYHQEDWVNLLTLAELALC